MLPLASNITPQREPAISPEPSAAIARVPTEILLEILRHLTRRTPFGTELTDPDSLLTFSHVCRRWNELASSSPAAWCDMDLSWPVPRSLHWLSRAADHIPRCFLINPNPEEHMQIDARNRTNLLIKHYTQLEFLSLYRASIRDLETFLGCFGRPPFLIRTLELTIPDNDTHVAMPLTTALSVRSLSTCHITGIQTPPISYSTPFGEVHTLRLFELPRIHGSSKPTHWRYLVPRMPALRRLTITHKTSRYDVHDGLLGLYQLTQGDERFELPVLQTLCLGQPGVMVTLLAYNAYLPRLRTLLIGEDLVDAPLMRSLVSLYSPLQPSWP